MHWGCYLLLLLSIFVAWAFMDVNIKKVHLINMNHLDIGYDGIYRKVGFVNNVLNDYFHIYFPRAIQLSQQLRQNGYVETFQYTTHPWLVSMYLDCPQNFNLSGILLKCPDNSQLKDFISAIQRGDITWHAGPMNLQAENSVPWLYEYGLTMAENLDKEFGIKRKVRVLSQRDVPGMTKAVIPYLVKHGVVAVSVGVNGRSAPPAVPVLFKWYYKGDYVLATWHPGGYPYKPGVNPRHPGGLSKRDCVTFPGHTEALCYAFRNDNTGPPENIQEILNYYEILRAEFPNATIKASTFENFFSGLEKIVHELPNVTNEIGDTWIQGIASDPVKSAEFRAVARVIEECLLSGKCYLTDRRVSNLSRYLLKLSEHTWGLIRISDNINWSNEQFYKHIKGSEFVNAEKGWLEQRCFLQLAVSALGNHTVVNNVKAELQKLIPYKPDLKGFYLLSPENWFKPFHCEHGIMMGFSTDGAINLLQYRGLNWASEHYPLAMFMYNTYNKTDEDTLQKQYAYSGHEIFIKTNMTVNAHPDSCGWQVVMTHLYAKSDGSCEFYIHIELKENITWMKYGAPQSVWVKHTVRKLLKPGIDTEIQLFNKRSTRLPESLMFAYHNHPQPVTGYRWIISKLGQIIDPTNVLVNGSQFQHGLDDRGLYYIDAKGNGLQINSLDVPVVAPLTKNKQAPPVYPLLQPKVEDIKGMAFLIYNNVWNTNYITWFPYRTEDKDFKVRFSLDIV